MRIGLLRHRVQILSHAPQVDDFGAPIPLSSMSWGVLTTVWASIDPVSGREYFSSQQVQSEVTSKIHIRWLEGVKPDMRVKHGNTVYAIISVLPDNRRKEMVLMCKELSSEQENEEENEEEPVEEEEVGNGE